MSANTIHVAVVGLGPRGLSVLERLCANAPSCLRTGATLKVHIIDEHLLEGGRVWRSTQHPELLMNTVASQVSMFLDESVDCAGPVVHGPSLFEWARSNAIDDLPERPRAEAVQLGADSYPSRALYGCYLRWTLRHVIDSAPGNMTVELHRDRAVDLADGPDATQEITLAAAGRLRGLHAVVLAQGHLPHALDRTEADLARFAETHGLHYIPPGNPAEADLRAIGRGETVILRGLGLNFFDHMALLTVGRGGRFGRDSDGRLRYQPSGFEPHLVAGSRRGVPFHARGANEKGPYGRHRPRYLTADVIGRLRALADQGAPADFRRDIWPLIDLEVRTVYYVALVRQRTDARRAHAFTAEFVARATDSVRASMNGDPIALSEQSGIRTLLAEYGIEESAHWDWAAIEKPYTAVDLTSTADYRRWLRDYLDRDVREATRGNVRGPLKAALDVLRDLRNEIRLLVDHGGLSGDSYRDDLQRWYTPLNAYLSIGPPVHRIEQFIALLDCGLLEALGPGLQVSPTPDGEFLARSAAIPDLRIRARALIEARMPDNDLRRTTDPLLRSLLARGECRPYRIPNRGGGWYTTGGIAVTHAPYRLLDARNRPHPGRFAFGVPTETVHWATAAGIRPGVNSVILSDADALSRAALGAADHSNHTPTAEFVTP